MIQKSRDTDRNDGQSAGASHWRSPNSFGGAVLAGLASSLILLAGGNVVKNVDIDISECTVMTTVYSATITATLPSAC